MSSSLASSSSPKKPRAGEEAAAAAAPVLDSDSAMGGLDFNTVVPVQAHAARNAHVDKKTYDAMYAQSIREPAAFWSEQARRTLHWDVPFTCSTMGSFAGGDVAWFLGGKLNACVQCLDRHVWDARKADKVALVWEGDEVGSGAKFTFREVLAHVCRLANALKALGVMKGDAVTIYMPMVPEIIFAMLACARLGAPHSVVFAGFSAEALRERVVDVHSRFVFTCDEGMRGGRAIPLKRTVDEALADARCAFVQHVLMYKRTGNASVPFNPARDLWVAEEAAKYPPYCPAELMDSEDTLFYLYTSGSTGKPKGVAHTTAGYLLMAGLTHKYVFDVHEDDSYACVADCGWITGHTYIVYGPLVNGNSTLMFESTPLYPNASRYWDLVQRHKLTQFYTAPTAIRALMKEGLEPFKGYDLSSLRVIGSVGEPIGPAPWRWYFENVGSSRCAVVDTYWQTETGSIICSPLPGVTPMKPGSCCAPFFGIDPVLLDPASGKELVPNGHAQSGLLCLRTPFPSITRTVRGDHERYMKTYFAAYPGVYLTGDGAVRDPSGYLWITGRVDDVLNVSGHRVGSAELESAINSHQAVAECAIIGFPHDIKGEGIAAYVILKGGFSESPELIAQIRQQVRSVVGAFATPDYIIVIQGLPKTRSGKIMRRILRKIVSGQHDQLGDVSTLAEPQIIDQLVTKVLTVLEASKQKKQ